MDQKLDAQLSLSLSLSEEERKKSPLLNSGYISETGVWKLILLYNGSLSEIKEKVNFDFIPLLGNFAIIYIKTKDIPYLLSFPEILYIEPSRPLYQEALTGISSSCFPDYNIVTGRNITKTSLTGRGTAIAIPDSGVDFRHPDFRTPEGNTRILSYWDQSLPYVPSPDNRYGLGTIFSAEDLNGFLARPSDQLMRGPSVDTTGHGTHIAGICAGNGRGSNGRNQGAAPEASLIVIKLKNEASSVYTDYANLMMAVDFSVRYSIHHQLPLSLNISYGSNDGSHTGSSLCELFLNQSLFYGKNSICVATGNEGLTRRHASFRITDQKEEIRFSVSPGETSLYLTIWQAFADIITYRIFSPSGNESFFVPQQPGIYTASLGGNTLSLVISDPTPYQTARQHFFSLVPALPGEFLTAGTWRITVEPRQIVDGRLHLWLPSRDATNAATGFASPASSLTLTIPSTSSGVISVSGYDSTIDVFAPFSGKGFSGFFETKPDLAAPAVNILGPAPGGGYTIKTGTSMAAPFVAGAASLLMQYGIVNGNDPFLFGQKLKAYLWAGARPLPAFREYPNDSIGWGALCFDKSLPVP